jgi:hypothetical protein
MLMDATTLSSEETGVEVEGVEELELVLVEVGELVVAGVEVELSVGVNELIASGEDDGVVDDEVRDTGAQATMTMAVSDSTGKKECPWVVDFFIAPF